MWKNININTNLIIRTSDFGTLIKCPNSSNYKGYCFWHTNKCIRPGKHSASISLGYTEDFEFTLKKYGSGKYNHNEVISEAEINAAEFEEIFGVINDNIKEAKEKVYDPMETHKPDALEAENQNVLDELVDDE